MENTPSLLFLTSTIIRYLTEKEDDVEEELKKIGRHLGVFLLEKTNFKREVDLPTLLYKITYSLLEDFYHSHRKIEKSDEEDVYLLTDKKGLFSEYFSVPKEWEGFCADSITCGIIEAALLASGWEVEVTAFCKRENDRVVFQIRLLSDKVSE